MWITLIICICIFLNVSIISISFFLWLFSPILLEKKEKQKNNKIWTQQNELNELININKKQNECIKDQEYIIKNLKKELSETTKQILNLQKSSKK